MIPLAEPVLGGNEARYLAECIETGFVSSVGPFVERFEQRFAEAVRAGHAVACASGTAALHVALRLAGAGPGRLVAVSDFTFIASANAAAYTGADVLLVDSEPDTWNMDTELLYDEVTRRARLGEPIPDVVEVVHVLGHPAAMEPLLELRSRFGVRIVEDAAEALGASWTSGPLAGRQVGTVSDLGCYSFNGNKIITTGGGGMIVTADAEYADAARHLANQAKVAGGHYEHDTVGYNYRLTNLAAAVGVAQLERLPELLAAKRSIASRYDAWLSTSPFTPAPRAAWADPSYWLYSVLAGAGDSSPDDVVARLAAAGAQARRLWPPLHRQRPYASARVLGGAVADDLHRRGISLPSTATLSAEDQEAVVATALTAVGVGA
ncbi:DegT/DnrJ/EryC1/StrS family aminotransferase [Jiangella alkaliphila]|uniref:dTDP-4-amino-4,6-dideoxygalactose transaminase n=1 Tax=Jiangella alkaliphila TaxID=419479 RepID=A0A1H2K4H8_9ACTN|nr:DegT/DnrJ/EryC1/StrS family aminotransferase [Jiangella alkaliphila]SDU63462.1 dTDP-4-amino-4,6-dideoxygalactose transaminase [Jiangella alkaliphila]